MHPHPEAQVFLFLLNQEPSVSSGSHLSLREVITGIHKDATSAPCALIPSPLMPEDKKKVPSPLMGEAEKNVPSPLMGEGKGGGDSLLSVTHINAATHLEEAASVVSADEREHAMRLYRKADRQSYIFAHAILRLLLSIRLKTDPGGIQFRSGMFGKPALLFPRREFHFNLSHADNAIAIGLAGAPIGVDIDAVRDDIDPEGVGQRFFAADELDYLNCPSPGEKRKRFFYIWTRKEALTKAAGTGLDGITFVSVLNATVRMADESGLMGEYGVHTLSPPPGYALALALQAPSRPRSSRAPRQARG